MGRWKNISRRAETSQPGPVSVPPLIFLFNSNPDRVFYLIMNFSGENDNKKKID